MLNLFLIRKNNSKKYHKNGKKQIPSITRMTAQQHLNLILMLWSLAWSLHCLIFDMHAYACSNLKVIGLRIWEAIFRDSGRTYVLVHSLRHVMFSSSLCLVSLESRDHARASCRVRDRESRTAVSSPLNLRRSAHTHTHIITFLKYIVYLCTCTPHTHTQWRGINWFQSII